MIRHTPGPWEVIEYGTDSAGVRIGDIVVCGSYKGGNEDLLSPDDAYLIAKAPELLARLGGLLSVINMDRDGSYFICQEAKDSIDDAHALIDQLLIDQLKEPIA